MIRNAGSVQVIAFLVVMLFGLAKGSASGATPLGQALVELDSHIKLTAADDDWKAMGKDWVDQTTACADPACVAGQLATLEAHVKWEAVDPAWKKRRESWVEECENAKTDPEVSKLLLDFEQTVNSKAVDEQWKGRRDGWVAAVKKGPTGKQAGSARADDSLKYPKAAPLLTISPTVAGFSAESTEGDDAYHLLRLPNEDGEKFPTVLLVTLGKEKTLKEDLNTFSHGFVDSMKLTDTQYDTETQIELPLSSQTESATGKREGESMTVTAVAIPLKNQNVIAIVASPSDGVEAARAKLAKLLKTLHPVD